MRRERFLEKLEKRRKLAEKDFLFVVGAQGSGTTWAGRMINAHPAIICVNEARLLHTVIAPMLRASQMRNEDLRKRGRAHLSVSDEDQEFLVMSHYLHLFENESLEGVRYLGEKTPENLLDINLVSRIFEGARFVHVVRDARDALVSCFHKNLNQPQPQSWADYAKTFLHTFWLPYNANYLAAQARAPQQWASVRYEDMKANPHEGLRHVYRFLDLDASDELVDAIVADFTFEAMKGSDKADVKDRFYRKGEVGDWKNHDDAALAAAYRGPVEEMNRQFGYA